MKNVSLVLCAFAAAGIMASTHAANVEEGKAKAFACASCHGQDGVSVNPTIPNLAGQKEAYLINQLKAFKDGARKHAMMNAVAAQLNQQEIENLAAFWNSLPGASGTAKSEIPAHILKTRVAFPENYQKDFTYYTTINFPDRKQVRKYYTNDLALRAARDGQPLPQGSALFVEVFSARLDEAKNPVTGYDGFYVPEKLLFYTAMETQPGWGDDFPDLFRNGDWNYAVFTLDKKPRAGVNQAECLACHKPLTKDSYVFSLEALRAKAKMSR